LQGYSYDDIAPINDMIYIVAGALYKDALDNEIINCDKVRYLSRDERKWLINLVVENIKNEIKKKLLENPYNEDLCEPRLP
jgi:hypothetical protein